MFRQTFSQITLTFFHKISIFFCIQCFKILYCSSKIHPRGTCTKRESGQTLEQSVSQHMYTNL